MKPYSDHSWLRTLRSILLASAAVLSCAVVLPACEEEGPAEELGESIDDAADDVQDTVDDAADDVEDAVDG